MAQARRFGGRHSPSHDRCYSTTRLEVPHSRLHHPSPLHINHYASAVSTSSSPSVSPVSSPSLTPMSPRSPMDHLTMDYPSYTSGYMSNAPLTGSSSSVCSGDSYNEHNILDEHNTLDTYLSSEEDDDFDVNGISDAHRQGRGLRPPPQVVSAQSLPNLLHVEQENQLSSISDTKVNNSSSISEHNLQSWITQNSLPQTTMSDSRTSTLVESTMVICDIIMTSLLHFILWPGGRRHQQYSLRPLQQHWRR